MSRTPFLRLTSAVAAACALALACGTTAAAPVYGTNLIVNGDAETGTGSTDGTATGPITGFTSTAGAVALIQYGAAGGYPTSADPGPGDRGNNFFGGGNSAVSSMSQLISLSSLSAAIDAGSVTGLLSAWLGGYLTQDDNATLTAAFRDANGTVTDTFVLGPVLNGQRDRLTGLVEVEQSFTVPLLTRDVLVTLTETRLSGNSNDGYADDLSLVLNGPDITPPTAGVPEPDVIALGALGALIAAAAGRRRRPTA